MPIERGMELISQGNLFAALELAFTIPLGVNGALILWGGLYLLGLAMVYMRNKEPVAVGIVMILTSGVMVAYFPPNIQLYLVVALILGITTVLYTTFIKK